MVEQIKSRFFDLHDEHGQPLNSLLGVGFDGKRFVFVRFRNGEWDAREPVELDRVSASQFLWALFNLGRRGKPFSPEYLADDFGAHSEVARNGVQALYTSLCQTDHPKADIFFKQWKVLFGEACGYDVDKDSEKVRSLAVSYGILTSELQPAKLLFALHGYYALLMKLLASEIVAFFHGVDTPLRKMIGATTSAKLKHEMEELEKGGIFRHLKITNFLEGDLFAWYTSVWSESIEQFIRRMASCLEDYNPGTLSEDPPGSRDLLKRLYEQLFPRAIRHDLGEYYTPDWLAEHVLNEIGYVGDPNKRLLDPGCGSGTFLVLAIGRIRAWYERNREACPGGEVELCQQILSNVIGFDLNPLAVMASRTNYLIAIRDLIGQVDRVEIPVYLCDSIATPSEYGLFAGTSIGGGKELRTAAGSFQIPGEIAADRGNVGKYADVLEDCVRNAYSEDEFVERCRNEGLPVASDALHTGLYTQLVELDRANQNGVWARIIKNAFAPLFVGTVDYIAGNPPWINWDSLPEDYREQNKRLWVRNGLFSLSGTAGRLGGGKKDIAMHFVYEAVRNYLKNAGRLGFVITQSFFKTEGGADGFRNFRLPGADTSEPFRVSKVDDLSALKPFQGAANRTAVLCVQRGAATRFPVPYAYWLPQESATIDPEASLHSVLESVVRLPLHAAPVYAERPNAPWLTVSESVIGPLRKAVGQSDYAAQAGATTCGADGVFLVKALTRVTPSTTLIENVHDAGKRTIPRREGRVSDEYLYPVCRGKDFSRWQSRPELLVLMVQDPGSRVGISEQVLKRHPGTWEFISQFKKELGARKSSMLPRKPFYSIYGVGRDTFAPFKVAWGRVSNTVGATVIGSASSPVGTKPVLPFEAMMIPFDNEEEAHYVCGCLNCVVAQLIVVGSIVMHPDTHVLKRVRIPKFASEDPLHVTIASASRNCHEVVATGRREELGGFEAVLDSAAGRLWGIAPEEIEEMDACLREMRGELLPSPRRRARQSGTRRRSR